MDEMSLNTEKNKLLRNINIQRQIRLIFERFVLRMIKRFLTIHLKTHLINKLLKQLKVVTKAFFSITQKLQIYCNTNHQLLVPNY